MYQFKSENDTELEAERMDLIWQMLTVQLEASHEMLMAQYGMEAIRPPAEEESVLRGPRRRVGIAPAPQQLPAPRQSAGPLRGG